MSISKKDMYALARGLKTVKPTGLDIPFGSLNEKTVNELVRKHKPEYTKYYAMVEDIAKIVPEVWRSEFFQYAGYGHWHKGMKA